MKATTIGEKPKQRKGFAVMTRAARTRIAAMGGRKTARKLGRKYMATIGRRGRLLRAARERKAKAALKSEAKLDREYTTKLNKPIRGTLDGNPPYDAKKLKASAKAFADRANKHYDAAVNAALQDQDA